MWTKFWSILLLTLSLGGLNSGILAAPLGGGSTSAEMAALEERVRILEEMVFSLQAQLRAEIGDSNGNGESEEIGEAPAAPEPVQQAASQLAAAPAKSSGPAKLNVTWSEGLKMEAPDKAVSVKIGGRIMNDWAFISGDEGLVEIGMLRDGTEFRRARVLLEGTIHNRVVYKAEYDFAGLLSNFRDVYVGLKDIPVVGNVKIGHQKEPFGLTELTSSKYIMFMERPLPNAFSPSRNTGVLVHNAVAKERATWAAGLFRKTGGDGFGVSDGGYNFSGRITGLPWYEDGGRKLLHLGAAYSRQHTLLNFAAFASRPEAHLAPALVFTGALPGRTYDLVGMEGAMVAGPFSVQGEYNRALVNTTDNSNPSFAGAYVQGSFFLTGENRRYKKSLGVFDRVRPEGSLFDGNGGRGALELAGRYSWLDLNDQAVTGGELKNFSFGLNWYLNSNTRWMWNYVHADKVDEGTADILQTRFQIDF